MSWLRVDDSFTNHPKFSGFSPQDRWAFLELMSYCARYRTRGKIPADLTLLPRSVGERLLRKAIAAGWIEERPDGRWIHDWDVYNPRDPTGAARSKRYRANRDDDRDDDRDVNRDIHSDESVTSRARPRARPRPVPGERDKSLSQSVTLNGDDEAARRAAWEERATAPDVRSPAAFVKAGIDSGEWPDGYTDEDAAERVKREERDQRHRDLLIDAAVAIEHWERAGTDVYEDLLDQIERKHHSVFTAQERSTIIDRVIERHEQ